MNFLYKANYLHTTATNKLPAFVLTFAFLLFSGIVYAQPANDNCVNASAITIGSSGFALGTLTSTQYDLTAATKQTGETFAPSITVSGLNKKSTWYKFSIATHRSIRVSLLQPGSAIQAGNVGFAVYKTNACIPGDAQISTKLSPIETFGNTFHPCVDAGDYMVQVTGNNAANGPVYITVEIAEASPAPYDKPATAYKFGKVSTNKVTAIDFNVDCQSIENAAEVCLPTTSFKDFTKSTWHTVTTPDYFDWFSVLLSENSSTNYYGADYVVGYRLYEGDASTKPLTSLILQGGCDSFLTNGYYIDKKIYKCGQLKTNTTYTIQLLYHKDFVRTMRLAVAWNGVAATKGPEPIGSLPAPNKMGTLATNNTYGVTTTVTDNFGCNSRHNQHSCPKSMPVNGVLKDGWRYNLSSFFSFKLTTTTTLNISAYYSHCSPGLLMRLYKQDLTANCTDLDTANIKAAFVSSGTASCLDPGNYVLQVMGVDSSIIAKNYYSYGNLYTSTSPLCLQHSLGSAINNVSITAKTEVATNKFSLSAAGKFDKINAVAGVMKPLVAYQLYKATPDTFGCANTVLPDGNICAASYGAPFNKASYREFVVNDSFMLQMSGRTTWETKLYKGDANALATAQSAFNYPEKIIGLTPYTKCLSYSYDKYACITSGTYTLVSFDNRLGLESKIEVTPKRTKTKYATPATAQDMGSIWDKIDGSNIFDSGVDTFTCYDNPATIDGVAPCNENWGKPTTKLIYRQFYLKEPAVVHIFNYRYYNKYYYGTYSLFKGKATDGLTALKTMGGKWTCFTSAQSTDQCDALPAGWYTVVSYGYGGSYSNPLHSNPGEDHSSLVGEENGVYISLTKACAEPQFNRPYKASVDTTTKKPYLIQWGPQTGHTTAYPVTYKKYSLNRENFNCTQDTAFIRQNMRACDAANVKVAFYVFETKQESFVQIDIPNGLWGAVYDFDVRTTDSAKLKTGDPLQTCLDKQGQIQICKLKPGTYTLVFFAPVNYTCNTVTPTIYIDQVGYSRFDHAAKAYDFGVIKADSVWYNGKQGDVNPLNNGRAPSNDFFYCTTGAQEKDPGDAACMSLLNPEIYKTGDNVVLHPDNSTAPNQSTIDRRNLWYTFTVNQPGLIRIKVENKTPGKMTQYPFAVYKSDVDGSLSFESVVSGGLVDSTLLQGLTYISNNLYYYYCDGYKDISIYNDPCTFKPTRYYVMVENRNPYAYGSAFEMNPNHQVEVSVLLDQANAIPTRFDHYSQANDLGLVNNGRKKGAIDNFSCATRDLTDPIYAYTQCQKTLWYKFTTTTTGQIRYAAFFKNTNNWYYDHIQLFRKIKENDSSATGLQHMPYTTNYSNNGTWAQQCISPGTYYIILPGCNALNEDVYPEIEIIPQAGDFCSAPMITSINGAGSKVVSATVDCHTIGTDYGEFNPTLTCPAGGKTSDYKTSWYRLDIGGRDTLDVTVFINEKTNASNTEIKYRMMTGNCGAMQEQSCVQDALTRNTYKCLAPGNSYYIQVFTPLLVSGYYPVTGDIDLNISSVKHADTCLPASSCIAVANFTPRFDCTKDQEVVFTNFSTYGSSIKYEWSFGYNNQKSSAVSPRFFYPALTAAKNYTVKLVVTNNECGKKDSITQTINIPARPSVNLGKDTVICTAGTSVSYDVTSHTGSTYYWYTGSTAPAASFNSSQSPWVEVTYKGCVARDTVNIWINPIAKQSLQTLALCHVDKVTLNSNRGYGEQFKWSTGATTSSIEASQPGYYWADLYLNGCTVRDSFLVVSTSLRPLGNDTTICQANMPYTANATVSGASSYSWQNGAGGAEFKMTKPGLYWVDINLSGCTFRDTLVVTVDSFKTSTVKASICEGQKYKLPSGRWVSVAATYKDSLKNSNGCDSVITTVSLTVDAVKRVTDNVSICAGQSYTLPSGNIVSVANAYADTARNIRGCDSIISVINLTVATVRHENKAATICKGQSYTLPSGKTVSTGAVYSDTLKAKAGCDSLITTIDLKVLSPVVNTSNAAVCFGKTFTLPGGRIVNASGLYKDTIRYMNGCDSLISNITVSVGTAIIENKKAFVCEGQWYSLPGGRQVNTTAFYKDTVRSVAGCDSLISTIDLTVQTRRHKNTDAFVCSGSTYTLPSGKKINATGVYNDTLYYTTGCDSVITVVDLVVFNVITHTISVSICSDKTYTLPSGRVINSNGLHRDTIRYKNGCDSLISDITLSIGEPVRKSKTEWICPGNTYQLPSGRIVSIANIYTDTLRSAAGCDSLINTITLHVDSPQKRVINESVCKGQAYLLPSGKQVFAEAVYLDTLHNIRGCDSLHFTINLQINDVSREDKAVTICTGQTHILPTGKPATVAGIYTDTLKTIAGCDSIITTSLTVRPALKVIVSGTKTICAGGSSIISALVTGGNGGPYTYSWTGAAGGGSSIVVNPAVTTKYKLAVSDGCTLLPAMDSITITVVPIPDATIKANTKNGCGPLLINFSNNTNGVRYHWDFGTGIAADTSVVENPSFTYQQPGNYNAKLVLTTPEGCTNSGIENIIVSATPASSITALPQICAGTTADFKGNVNNVTGIVWSWNFGNGNTSDIQNPTAQAYPTAGNYTVQLITKNAAGCADTAAHKLKVAAIPVPGLGGAEVKICAGAGTPLTAQQGIIYSWTPVAGLNNPAMANPLANPDTDTRYYVTVTNDGGCSAIDSILVRVIQPFTLTTSPDTLICAGTNISLQASGAVRYEWAGDGLTGNTTAANITVKPTDTTTYTVKAYGPGNCFAQTAQINIKVIPLPSVNAGRDTIVMVGSSLSLLPVFSQDVTGYSWSPSSYLDCNDCPFPVATPREPLAYTITVRNDHQCEARDTRMINLLCDNESVFVPNTFTPNGDGVNDIFYPRGNGIKSVKHLRVYNRWGQLIFERMNFNTDDRNAGWDGTFKGQKLSPDVYVYSLAMVCDNNQAIETKGNIMIVR